MTSSMSSCLDPWKWGQTLQFNSFGLVNLKIRKNVRRLHFDARFTTLKRKWSVVSETSLKRNAIYSNNYLNIHRTRNNVYILSSAMSRRIYIIKLRN